MVFIISDWQNGKRRWASCAHGLGALLVYSHCIAQEITLTDSTIPAEQWIEPNTAITLTFERLPAADEGRIAVLLDTSDLSGLFQQTGTNELVYLGDGPPLPSGSHELIIYQVRSSTEWEEITRLPINILTPSGFEVAETTPKLELALTSQLASNTTGDAIPLERGTYQDLEGHLDLGTRHKRGTFEIRSNVIASGFSYRPDALRFSELGEDAPKLDLNQYLIEVESGSMALSQGHISYGNQPLLIDISNNRGTKTLYRLGDRFDFGFGLMNGTSIVGYNNILGWGNYDESLIAAATFGVEWLPERPGGLRTELTYMDGKKPDESDFDTGEIPDAEESRGFGLRILGSSASGRLRGEFNYARSRFTNPDDPNLAFDDEEIVQVKPSTDSAYGAEIAYDILEDEPLIGDTPVALTATLRYAYADALYRSLGALIDANLESYTAGLDGRIGEVGTQLAYSWIQDNVEDIPTLLTTRTRGLSFALIVPFKTMVGDPDNPSWWLPEAAYTLERVHQQAVNSPDPELSGFDSPSQLPDQVTRVNAFDLMWAGERWDFAYRLVLADEDNRQQGREQADFNTLENAVVLGLRPWDTLNLSFGLGRTRINDREQNLNRFTHNYSTGVDWSVFEDWTFSGTLGLIDEDDDDDISRSDSVSAQAQISYRFDLPGPGGRRLPGQWFLRYTRENLNQRDREFDIDSSATTWTINAGIGFSFH